MPKRVSANSRIIAGLPPNIRAGFGIVERRYIQARRDLACTEEAVKAGSATERQSPSHLVRFGSGRCDQIECVVLSATTAVPRRPLPGVGEAT
jgi:hypothetical protein